MGSLEITHLLVGIPLFIALAAVSLTLLWSQRRGHLYLLWQAAAMGLLGWGGSMDAMPGLPWGPGAVGVWAFWCSAWAVAQAMSMRFGQSAKAHVAILLSVLMLLASWLSAEAHWSAQTRFVLGALAIGFVLTYVLPEVWRAAGRHRADQLLRGVYSFSAAFVLLLPWVLTQSMLVLSMQLMGVLVSVMMMICVLRDGASKPRTAQYRDASTLLLNRAGLDAAFSSVQEKRESTVFILCELKHIARLQRSITGTHKSVAQEFAMVLKGSVRDGDLVARVGAEEFVMVLRGMDIAQVQALLVRIQAALLGSSALASCSASFGVAQVYETDTLDIVLHRADVALYQTKEESTHIGELSGAC